jgi:hypothetical protein
MMPSHRSPVVTRLGEVGFEELWSGGVSANMPAIALACSIQAYSDPVDVIYAGVLEPDRWRDALRMIAEIAPVPFASTAHHDIQNARNELTAG